MKVTREQAAKNREQILDTAARLFRERGLDGIGVADLMREAGFTHGGFYGHFESKEDLMAQACRRAFEGKEDWWNAVLEGEKRGAPLAALAKMYLTEAHRDAPGEGCPMPALAVDVSRQSPEVRRSFTEGIRRAIERLASKLTGRPPKEQRREAIRGWTSVVGALVLARAVDDPALSTEILRAVRESLQEK